MNPKPTYINPGRPSLEIEKANVYRLLNEARRAAAAHRHDAEDSKHWSGEVDKLASAHNRLIKLTLTKMDPDTFMAQLMEYDALMSTELTNKILKA